jgi:hypothetical protein
MASYGIGYSGLQAQPDRSNFRAALAPDGAIVHGTRAGIGAEQSVLVVAKRPLLRPQSG